MDIKMNWDAVLACMIFVTNLSFGLIDVIFSVFYTQSCSTGFLPLEKWLLGAGIFAAIIALTLPIVFYRSKTKNSPSYTLIVTLQITLFSIFLLIWMLVGSVVLFNNSKECKGNPVWIMSLITLIFYCIEFTLFIFLTVVEPMLYWDQDDMDRFKELSKRHYNNMKDLL
jgi:hypothetical protein